MYFMEGGLASTGLQLQGIPPPESLLETMPVPVPSSLAQMALWWRRVKMLNHRGIIAQGFMGWQQPLCCFQAGTLPGLCAHLTPISHIWTVPILFQSQYQISRIWQDSVQTVVQNSDHCTKSLP